MNARNEEIDKLIIELENLDIIGLVRECRITPEVLAKLLKNITEEKA